MAIIDTLKIYESLKAQMPERSARAVAEVLEQSFEEYRVNQREFLATKQDQSAFREATRQDIAEFREATKQDIAEFREATKQDIVEFREATKEDLTAFQASTKVGFTDLRSEFKQDMAALRAEFKQDLAAHQADTDVKFAKLRTEIAGVRSELIKWMFIFWVGQIGALVTFLLALR